mgnify:CR=1
MLKKKVSKVLLMELNNLNFHQKLMKLISNKD